MHVKDIVERLYLHLITKFHKTASVDDMKRRPRSSILGEEHYRFVNELMAENTDLTSRQLYAAFKEAYPSMAVSVSTMKRAI